MTGISSLSATCDLAMPATLAWQKPFNEVNHPSGIVGTVWLEKRLSVSLILWR